MTKDNSPIDNLAKSALTGFSWQYISVFSQAFLNLLVIATLSRLLSPKDFGVMGIATIFVGLAELFSQLGVGPAIVQHKDLNSKHLRIGFSIAVMLGVIMLLILWGTAPFIALFFENEEITNVLRGVSFNFLIGSFGVVSEGLLIRRLNFKKLMWINLIGYGFGYGVIGITLAWSGYGVWTLVIATLSQTAIKSFLLLKLEPHPIKPIFSRREFQDLVYFGGGFTLARLFNYSAKQGDYFVVGRLLGSGLLGIYTRAYKLMMIPGDYFGKVVGKVLFPVLSKIQNERPRLTRAYLTGVAMVSLVCAPLGVLMVVSANEIVGVLLGSQWVETILPFQILSIGVLPRVAYKLDDSLARALGALYQRSVRDAIYAGAVVLGAWVGLNWGLPGVAVGVLLAVVLNFLLAIKMSLRLLENSWSEYLKVQLPGIFLGFIVVIVSVPTRLLAISIGLPDWLILVSTTAASGLTLLGLYLVKPQIIGVYGTAALAMVVKLIPNLHPSIIKIINRTSEKKAEVETDENIPLKVILKLFENLEKEGVRHCNWKSSMIMDRVMAGKSDTDIDLLVDKEQAVKAEEILTRLGYKKFLSQPWARYPGIEDWIGFDADTGKLVHVHLHYQLVTGIKHVKEQHLPWEDLVLDTAKKSPAHNVFVIDPNLEIVILVIRIGLKISNYNLISSYWRKRLLPKNLQNEFKFLRGIIDEETTKKYAVDLLGNEIGHGLWTIIDHQLLNKPKEILNIKKLNRKALVQFRLYNKIKVLGIYFYRRQLFYRSKLFRTNRMYRQTGKRPIAGGSIIAIIGSDGSGKSTLSSELQKWLAWKIDAHQVYLGSGDGSIGMTTQSLKFLARLFSSKSNASQKNSRPQVSQNGNHKTSNNIIKELGSCLLDMSKANEKYRKMRKLEQARLYESIMITDRYPQNQYFGIYDGPKIQRSDSDSKLRQFFTRLEKQKYQKIIEISPDIVIKLHVPIEQALIRKPDHSAENIQQKSEITRKLKFNGAKVIEIDAIKPFEDVLKIAKQAIWVSL